MEHINITQELLNTSYTKQKLKQLNNLHKEFIGIGTTKYDETDGLCNARGGVAIMYRKNLAKYFKQFQTNLDWCNAIEINIALHKVIFKKISIWHINVNQIGSYIFSAYEF